MLPKPSTAGAPISGGYGLRFRKVGLLTYRHPLPRCLLGIPTRHSILWVEVQWQTSYGKLILEGGNVGATLGCLGFHRRFTAAGPSRIFTGVPCCLTSFNARESPYAGNQNTQNRVGVNRLKVASLVPKFASAGLRESPDLLVGFSRNPTF